MTGGELADEVLMSLFEAARWAPSSYNNQLAMIAIGMRGSKDQLPPLLQEREYPNDRKPLKEIVMEGLFQHPKV